jgi:hypothetical protein
MPRPRKAIAARDYEGLVPPILRHLLGVANGRKRGFRTTDGGQTDIRKRGRRCEEKDRPFIRFLVSVFTVSLYKSSLIDLGVFLPAEDPARARQRRREDGRVHAGGPVGGR